MIALVSGQAAVAVLIDEGGVASFDIDRPDVLVPRTMADLRHLLGEADDVVELRDATREQAAELLEELWSRDRALHLILIALDPYAEPETRRAACECLEELFAIEGVADFLIDRLYSAPLPSESDLPGVIVAAGPQTRAFLAQLLQSQGEIRRWREAWDGLPLDLFRHASDPALTKHRVACVLTRLGIFRLLVEAGDDSSALTGVAEYVLEEAATWGLLDLRKILTRWRDQGEPSASSSLQHCLHDTSASSPLQLYLHDINDTPLLSVDEERALAARIAEGDPYAREHMVEANLRLVVNIARGYLGKGLSLEDLIEEGNLGLMRAVEEFDPNIETRFSTYASYWIKESIRHALTNTTATIRLPAHSVQLLSKWRKAERALARELGQAPTRDQVAVSMGLTDAQRSLVDQALLASQLRTEGGAHGDDGAAWDPEASSDWREAPEAHLEAEDDRLDLIRRLARLDDRERTILTLRFGLEGQAPLTLKEVGQRLGVTREWVRKIETQALAKLMLDSGTTGESHDSIG